MKLCKHYLVIVAVNYKPIIFDPTLGVDVLYILRGDKMLAVTTNPNSSDAVSVYIR